MSAPTSSVVPSWLLKAKVSTPGLGGGYVPRDTLLERLDAVFECRFAVLQAPAGFGKTTLLADFSRGKQEQGLVAGWISLDEDDTPGLFGSYLAYALECAGLDLSVLNDLDAWSSSPVAYQVGLLARAIDLHGAPCLLVLDEVDRLPRGTIRLIQRLMDHAPGNLHLALAFRSNPGIDLTMQVFDGSGFVVDAEALLFSRAEIARFFGDTLSRRELIEIEERTGGWPVAVRVCGNSRAGDTGRPGTAASRITGEFVRMRLLRGLSDEDRRFVCELAVFDWIDPDLVDEVLGSTDSRERIAALSSLDGLLTSIGEERLVRRLHPLVRDCCTELLAIEDRARERSLHVGIARALARRGQLISAWRHARAAGDEALVAELVEGAGVFEMWLRHGLTTLFSAAEFLTPENTASHPRLQLLRSIVLRLSVQVDEATALYESVERKTDGFTRDREGGDAEALAVEGVFALLILTGGSHVTLDREVDTLLPADEVSDDDERGALRLGARHMLLCGSCYERARLDECRRHAALARTRFGDESRYVAIPLDVYRGMAAMAQGRVQEAAECYERARRRTRSDYSADACLAACVDAVTLELDLERNREKGIEQRTLDGLAELHAIWTDIDSAAAGVAAELTWQQHGARAVMGLLTKSLDRARLLRSETLSRCVSGLLVFYLAEAGRSAQAARMWRDLGLPDDPAALLDLDGQSWRTMESLACARVRLLTEQGEFAAAEALAAALCATASERGLLRTRLRGLALSMIAAERAGDKDRALARLVEFLRLAWPAEYVRPLIRCPDVSLAVLRRLLDTEPDPGSRDAAGSILEQLAGRQPNAPVFSEREVQVLAAVRHGLRNHEIATRLGISQPGVRFHLANIYRKTGVSDRREAVRIAESLGVVD